MTKVIASRDCSNAAGTRAQKVGDHGLVWRSFVHGMLLTNGGVLDKFTCQVIPGVVHAAYHEPTSSRQGAFLWQSFQLGLK